MMHQCLACGNQLGAEFFRIPDLPLVDSFCESLAAAQNVPCYTVSLRQCESCLTIQVASPPDTSDIYRSYIYESSSSPDLDEHFEKYADFFSHSNPDLTNFIMEIGANDGLLTRKLVDRGFKNIVAFDPSPQTAKIQLPGVEIINKFFCRETADHLKENSFSMIIANNCLSHIPNLVAILDVCKRLLKKNGVLVVEVQSTLDLIEGVVFDYVYHEHYFYHTATSLDNVTRLSGLEIYSIKHVTTKGGSYRFLIGHPGQHKEDGSLAYWKYRESILGVHTNTPWRTMENYLQTIKANLQNIIAADRVNVFGYGASATGTVFLNYMGLEEVVKGLVDDNPKRQGMYAPGSGIPVISFDKSIDFDLCLILAWRHQDRIVPKLRSLGIDYVVPLPTLTKNG